MGPNVKEAVSLLIFNESGKILSVSRRFKPNDKNLPGGKIDPGETAEQAAIRECFEETGLHITNVRPYYNNLCPGGADGISYHTTTFTADYDPDETLVAEPDMTVSWITWSELLSPWNSFAWYNRRLWYHFCDTYEVSEGGGI